jgi:hypothetical protein
MTANTTSEEDQSWFIELREGRWVENGSKVNWQYPKKTKVVDYPNQLLKRLEAMEASIAALEIAILFRPEGAVADEAREEFYQKALSQQHAAGGEEGTNRIADNKL